MKINEWVCESLIRKGIKVNSDGSLDICFTRDQVQHITDLDAALRQQKHIIDQQKDEQKENEEIGVLMKKFHETVLEMTKMTVKQLSIEKKIEFRNQLSEILVVMSRKTNELRKDGYNRLNKVMKMIDKNNLPAANLASQAALDRMRRRWLVNEKVIDKSLARLQSLKELK